MAPTPSTVAAACLPPAVVEASCFGGPGGGAPISSADLAGFRHVASSPSPGTCGLSVQHPPGTRKFRGGAVNVQSRPRLNSAPELESPPPTKKAFLGDDTTPPTFTPDDGGCATGITAALGSSAGVPSIASAGHTHGCSSRLLDVGPPSYHPDIKCRRSDFNTEESRHPDSAVDTEERFGTLEAPPHVGRPNSNRCPSGTNVQLPSGAAGGAEDLLAFTSFSNGLSHSLSASPSAAAVTDQPAAGPSSCGTATGGRTLSALQAQASPGDTPQSQSLELEHLAVHMTAKRARTGSNGTESVPWPPTLPGLTQHLAVQQPPPKRPSAANSPRTGGAAAKGPRGSVHAAVTAAAAAGLHTGNSFVMPSHPQSLPEFYQHPRQPPPTHSASSISSLASSAAAAAAAAAAANRHHMGGLGIAGDHQPPGSSNGSACNTATPASEVPAPTSAQEVLPLYVNAAAAPSRLPAHKPVRLSQPKHPLAPPGTPVYFKYGEEHYPEETIPDAYTFTESDGTVCRYITNFLVYNKRGERLLPIEVLDQPRHGALVLYGSLLPASTVGSPVDGDSKSNGRKGGSNRRRSTGGRKSKSGSNSGESGSRENQGSTSGRSDQNDVAHMPYPVRVELSEWCIDYGQEPQNVPFVWLISRWDVYYRLEKPAGRYIPTFATAKMKFEVSTRVIKTLQYRPDFPYRELVDLLVAASREEKQRRRREDRNKARNAAVVAAVTGPGGLPFDDATAAGQGGAMGRPEEGGGSQVGGRKKGSRPNWKVHHSLSSPEGTGVRVTCHNGQAQPRTPWGAPFAVEGVRESTLLGLTEFLDSQLRNFLEGVGGAGGDCANLLDSQFMRTLRDKAAIRRDTLQMVEAKKRAIESMAAATSFPHLPPAFDLGVAPIVAVQVVQPILIRHNLAPGTEIAAGALMGGPQVTIGFPEGSGVLHKLCYEANPHHHQALLILKSRQQEEQELGELLNLLKQFSDPESDTAVADDDGSFDDSNEELTSTAAPMSSYGIDGDDDGGGSSSTHQQLRRHRSATSSLTGRRKRPRSPDIVSMPPSTGTGPTMPIPPSILSSSGSLANRPGGPQDHHEFT